MSSPESRQVPALTRLKTFVRKVIANQRETATCDQDGSKCQKTENLNTVGMSKASHSTSSPKASGITRSQTAGLVLRLLSDSGREARERMRFVWKKPRILEPVQVKVKGVANQCNSESASHPQQTESSTPLSKVKDKLTSPFRKFGFQAKARLGLWQAAVFKSPSHQSIGLSRGLGVGNDLAGKTWAEESDPPSESAFAILQDLESVLLEHHQLVACADTDCNMRCAFKRIANAESSFSKNDLHKFLSSTKKEIIVPSTLANADRVFNALIAVLRLPNGPIAQNDFLSFLEAMRHERALRLFCSDPIPYVDQLLKKLKEGTGSSAAAKRLLLCVASAVHVEPRRALNAFLLNFGPSGNLGIGVQHVAAIVFAQNDQAHGNLDLEVTIAGWQLCCLLAEQPLMLAEPPALKSKRGKKPKRPAKAKVAQQAYQPNEEMVTVGKLCKEIVCSGFPPAEVLWSLHCGATSLDGTNFKRLLDAAWAFLDSCQAPEWLLGPVGIKRLRSELEKLGSLFPFPAPGTKVSSLSYHPMELLLHHIGALVEDDPRLARTAALYGCSFLVALMRCWINSALDFDDFTSHAQRCSAASAASLNRKANDLHEILLPHTQAILDGHIKRWRLQGEDYVTEYSSSPTPCPSPVVKRDPEKMWVAINSSILLGRSNSVSDKPPMMSP
eukprot:gnl/MRDRNA2_/MRDRNA2_154144_c0_seq1.p1 gnl/MRDRNA2_/MRDRNA2_154144_c0~~gnl/MRDRNA2_/MRDRNA2_154144_c0_seq1.p1  ORF type:complete len:671 (+),score=91.77 gnl/MRDRNA2_/MRDRNA2_154144_c0_seq1:88-2100(+)